MDATIPQDQELLVALLAQSREELDGLSRELRATDAELESLATERKQHRLLLAVCGSLAELDQIGGADLFWGGMATGAGEDHIRRVRGLVDAFDQRVGEIESRRQSLIDKIKEQQNHTDLLEDDVFEALEEEERLEQEWIIEREISALPARQSTMPWNRGGEDDKRFRKSAATALALCLLIALIFPLIPLPSFVNDAVKVPDRVVRLLMEARPQPPPPPQMTRPQKEKAEQKLAKQDVPQQPVMHQVELPENKAGEVPSDKVEQGILAFREQFAAIRDDQVVARLGAKAQINDGDNSPERPVRAMLTTNGPGSSGGINLAALSRGVGGTGGGGGMAGVQVTRVSSGLAGIGAPGGERPLSGNGLGPSRTDEEIQIVFDRYKAALYRLYNRELRTDPTLRGQMVLRLTIEPDGSVSLCQLQASDMNAPQLSVQVVDRVKTINFGAKEGVAAITILYPIDFLPAA